MIYIIYVYNIVVGDYIEDYIQLSLIDMMVLEERIHPYTDTETDRQNILQWVQSTICQLPMTCALQRGMTSCIDPIDCVSTDSILGGTSPRTSTG